ncbi:hypothetical protein ACA910_013535 [Epithemia clementina (nom. ined.)]
MTVQRPAQTQPRGKPEAMTANIMRAKAKAARMEAEDDDSLEDADDDDDDDDDDDAAPVEAVVLPDPPSPAPVASTPSPSKKKSAASSKAKDARSNKKPAAKKKTTPSSQQRSRPSSPKDNHVGVDNLMESQSTDPISEEEYQNLDSLMEQFCRVPLLAEFSRPVKLLHPELAASYAKIVTRPVDLGHVCRGIRRRQYQNTRDVRLDMWRVFGNCVKFHSHLNNKEKVPSFVSIALHLREYFNSLWQEYMLPSELPPSASDALVTALRKRSEERKRRLDNSGVLMMSKKFLTRVTRLLGQFIESGGRTDVLDIDRLFDPAKAETPSTSDVWEVIRNIRELQTALEEMAGRQEEYSIDDFNRRLKECYSRHGTLEDNPALRNRFRNRLDRLVGKLTVPLHEANSRGVTQSSIWGNIATTIWARESSKKPYWPALCLGILPPEDQREGWHSAVTERNESRLPQKLRQQLMAAKKKCEAAQKRQSLSYFLVEFLGTHEFIWVRETDIVEKFDPKEDPNKAAGGGGVGGGSKKRASRSSISSVVGSKTYATALEECEWATDEFEQVLQEAFDFEPGKEEADNSDADDGEFMNYSYSLLNQSDEEADTEDKHGYVYDESSMSMSDIEEANWLLAHEGKVDTSVDARKQAKKRAQLLRKKKAEDKQKKEAAMLSQKKEKKKKIDAKAKEREAVKELKELEKRRKKRTREREKQLKVDMRKNKKRRPNPEAEQDTRGLGSENKRARATAIVKAFVHRMAQKGEYQGLHLGGSAVIPVATVESSRLLSLALAFRVAAGELDDSDGTTVRPATKPHEAVDTDSASLTEEQRMKNLKEKASLLEREIERLRANTRRRKELLHIALERKAQLEESIRQDDQTARHNVFGTVKKTKKNRKPTKGVGKTCKPAHVVAAAARSAKSKIKREGDKSPNDSGSETGATHTTTGNGEGNDEEEDAMTDEEEETARPDDEEEEGDDDDGGGGEEKEVDDDDDDDDNQSDT